MLQQEQGGVMGSTVLGPTLKIDHKLEGSLESYKRAVLEGTVSKREAQRSTAGGTSAAGDRAATHLWL